MLRLCFGYVLLILYSQRQDDGVGGGDFFASIAGWGGGEKIRCIFLAKRLAGMQKMSYLCKQKPIRRISCCKRAEISAK